MIMLMAHAIALPACQACYQYCYCYLLLTEWYINLFDVSGVLLNVGSEISSVGRSQLLS